MNPRNLFFVIFSSCLFSICSFCPEGFFQQCVQCPSGFVQLYKGCYYFSDETGPWVDGAKFCAKFNSHLVAIESLEESLALNLYLQNKHSNNQVGYWTSGSDIYQFRKFMWVAKGSLFDFTNWCAGEPNNASGGQENCVHIRLSKGKACWNDIQCTRSESYINSKSPLHFLCEYQPTLVIE